ncbi:MAG TPA: hypothetical protein VHL54_08925 [Actinomycetota bacterium]|nr:hypothetical protein [Actinomycetota bacterium]
MGKKARKAQKNEPAPTAPVVPAPPMVPTAATEAKKEKKGLFKLKKEEPKPPAFTPPPVPSRPATPPKPRFNAPFNYIPPGSTPPPARPSYPTTSAGAGNRKWQPPASFAPPPSPSFGSWGPLKPSEPEPPAQQEAAAPKADVSEPFVAAPEVATNGNGHPAGFDDDNVVEAGPWLLDLNLNGNGAGAPRKDPEVPAFIELSMFQDPTAADDIAAEDEEGDEAEESEPDASTAWMAEDAWPSARTGGREGSRSEEHPVGEQTRLMEDPWLQSDGPEPHPPRVEDWTSPEAPWPGETRQPAARSWADEAGNPQEPAARHARLQEHQPPQPAADPWADQRTDGDWVEDPFTSRRLGGRFRRSKRTEQRPGELPQESVRQAPVPAPEERPEAWGDDPRQPDPRSRRQAGWAPEETVQHGRDPRMEPWGGEPVLPVGYASPEEPGRAPEPQRTDPRLAAERPGPERDPRWATDPRLAAERPAPEGDPRWATDPRLAAERPAPERDPRWATDPRLAAESPTPAAERDPHWSTDPRLERAPAPAPAEEEWKPRSIELFIDDEDAETDPIAEAAARLKAAKNAIKVENGLAFVLVDDEGRPVLK